MFLIIMMVILTIAAFIGIGFIPYSEKKEFLSDGYYNENTYEFVSEAAATPTQKIRWKEVKAGTVYDKETNPGTYHSRKLQFVSLIFLLFILFGTIKTVGANKVGIEYDPFNGGVQTLTLQEGIHFRAPWVKVYNIDTVQQEIAFEVFSVQTNGSEFAWFVVEIKYKVNRANAFEVFRNYQGLPTASMVRQDVQDAIKLSAQSYNIYGILGDEFADVKSDAEERLRIKLNGQGIDLITLNIIDVDGGEQIEAKIVERGLAQQQQEIEQQLYQAALIAQQKEQVEAETARIVKQEQSDATLYQAQKVADAEAYKVQVAADAALYSAQQEALGIIAIGNAEASAYQVVITAFGNIDAYNQYIHFMQWNGTVPQIVMGDSGVLPIWDMGNLIEPEPEPEP
jgi:regulator of protease activity HflC (stomatin/prohibitin superfamily)